MATGSSQGTVSRDLRELFFEIGKGKRGQGVMVEIVHRITCLARREGLVRENGAVVAACGQHPRVCACRRLQGVFCGVRCATMWPSKSGRGALTTCSFSMTNIDSVDFPFITRNKRYIGFTNGLFDLVDGQLVGDHVLGAWRGAAALY